MTPYFTADFSDLIAHRAADVYADPAKFFSNTHPAQNLKDVAKAVFGRLANPNDSGLTLRLSTGFGGGKTHALMALWHLGNNIKDGSLGAELLPTSDRPTVVKVVAIDWTSLWQSTPPKPITTCISVFQKATHAFFLPVGRCRRHPRNTKRPSRPATRSIRAC